MAATSNAIAQIAMGAMDNDDVEIIEAPVSSQVTDSETLQSTKHETPSKQQKLPFSSTASTPAKTPSQLKKEEERLARMKQKEFEKQERERAKEAEKLARERAKEAEKLEKERAKEAERLEKEKKRLEKELERKKALEEKERIKREKKEQLQREKEEKEKLKLEEKRRKEEERLKKEEEKRKAEEEKKKIEEEKIRKKEKIMISNFFKPKSVVKSTTVTDTPASAAADADYKLYFHDFYLRDTVKLAKIPQKCDLEQFDQEFKAQTSTLKGWFKTKENNEVNEITTAKYIFTHQLDAAPLHMSFIRFYENIKTYIGSCTRTPPAGLATNPFLPCETPLIDWDNEDEEDEEGEGEDIDEDDDDEEDDEDLGSEEDLADFLEDDKENSKKRKAMGPLIPVISWHNITEMKVEILKEGIDSINPFTNYWEVVPEGKGNGLVEEPKAKKIKSLITKRDDLEKFAKQVHESDFTVPTMVELLKKQLPDYTKLTIENTLKNYAKKVGPKATEKKWEVDMESLRRAMESS